MGTHRQRLWGLNMPQRKARISIAELWQGTSEQPDYRRRPGQVERATNLRMDPIDGARKRSGTKLVGDLSGAAYSDWVWTSLNQFIIRVRSTGVEVFDRDATAYGVSVQNSATDYLAGAATNDIQLVPYLSSVLILNRRRTVQTISTPTYPVAGEKDVFTDLDGQTATTGQVWKVLQTEAENPAGYYRATANNPSLLDWTRVAAPADPDGRYDQTTMPIQLLYSGGVFTLKYLTWEDRKSGNTVTNAKMPWAGSTLQSLAIWSNRLVLMGQDSFTTAETLSSQQEGFNLWRDDVATPVDTDPIVLYLDLPNVGAPLRSVVLGRDLLVACSNGQVAVTSGDAPPSPLKFNVAMRLASSYKSLDVPLRANGEETVLIDHNGMAHLYAYQGVVNGIQKVLTLNEHRKDVLSGYSVNDAFQLGQAVFVPDNASEVVAVHDRFISGGQASQLAWSEYLFDRRVVYIDQYAATQYVVAQSGTECSLLWYDHDNLQEWYDTSWQPRLDRMHSPTLSYDSATNQTAVTLEGAADETVYVIDLSGEYPRVHKPVSVDGSTVFVRGNLTNGVIIAGWSFQTVLGLSKLWVGNARTMLQRMGVFYSDTTEFQVKAGRAGQTLATVYSFQSSLPFSAAAETGSIDFTVLGDARSTEIELVSNSPGPATFTALQYTVNAMEGS